MEQEKNKVLQVNVVTPDGNVYDHNATRRPWLVK